MRTLRFPVFFLFVALPLVGCGNSSPPVPGPASAQAPAGISAGLAEETSPSPREAPTVVFLGDSLTAGYGLDQQDAFPAVVAERLAADGVEARVVNAGISGDTTAGGLARLDWLLRQEPAVVVVALGANDGLRAVPLTETESNLREIVRRCQAAGARVILAGMMLPPNYGPEYTTGFREMFPKLARELGASLIPFLLEGVAAIPRLNQADGIHPNVEGQRLVAATVLPFVERELAGR